MADAAAAERPTIDQYFMDMTHLVKARGTCPRRRVGAVIVKDKRVLTTGYNGAPRNFPHPIDVGCLRDELQIPRGMIADICPCLHAEQNAIIQAATTGVSIDGAELYCTTQPCTQCSRMVANCGIKRVVFEEEYNDPLAAGVLTTAGVELWKWDAATHKASRVQAKTFEQAQDEVRRRFRAGTLVPSMPTTVGAPLPVAGQQWLPAKTVRQEEVVEDTAEAKAIGVRDLRDDPNRESLIKRMAREKAERKRQALAEDQKKRSNGG
ncbi:MAG: cytidine/deoxycytidylate deaminase family protein [Thermoplasmatota archaeon]|nr:dCMP deaminase family protein [Halobacteriales archaeon]